jgi:pimeloyl-ACP methyl ester carboxylesterase
MACSAVDTHRAWLNQTAQNQGFESHTVELGPHRIHHWVGGEGPTVIFLHGFGGNGIYTWWSQARTIARTHRVIVPDLLWFGESTSTAPPSLDAQANAVRALVDHLVPKDESVDVLGLSYGGFVALRYGQIEPQRQRSIVLVDSPGRFFDDQDEQELLKRYGVDTVEELFVPTTTERVRALIGLAYHKPPPLPEPLLRELKQKVFSQNQDEQRRLLADLNSRRAYYQADPLARYKKSLVIWGEHDQVFPVAIAHKLAEEMNAELLIVSRAGHAPVFDRPKIVNQRLESFLKR